MRFILSKYVEQAMAHAVYDKLEGKKIVWGDLCCVNRRWHMQSMISWKMAHLRGAFHGVRE